MFHNIDMNVFSDRVSELRKENGMTRAMLANKLNVSVRLISYWENGQRECGFEMLIRLADVFSVSVDYLLGRVDF